MMPGVACSDAPKGTTLRSDAARLLASWTGQVGFVVFAIGSSLFACNGSAHESEDSGEAGASETNPAPDADAPRSNPAPEAGACFIDAANYDQSCAVDTDCVATADRMPIQWGNYCRPMCLCGGDTINKTAVAKYLADLSKTAWGTGTIKEKSCGCPNFSLMPACVNGRCTTTSGVPTGVDDAGQAQDAEEGSPSG
jgi:hypothetical protein